MGGPDDSTMSWRREIAFLRREVRRLLADAELGDDAVQETMLAAWTRAKVAGPVSRGWLRAVLRNRVWTSLRRRERERDALDAYGRTRTSRPPPDREEIAAALRALDPETRNLVLRRVIHEESAVAIAADLGLPAATVRTRVRRGLLQLAERLSPQPRERRALVPWWGLGPRFGWRLAAAGVLAIAVAGLWTHGWSSPPAVVTPPGPSAGALAGQARSDLGSAPEPAVDSPDSTLLRTGVFLVGAPGAPLEDVQVDTFPADTLEPHWLTAAGSCVPDANGRLVLPPPAHDLAVVARAARHAPTVAIWPAGSSHLTLALDPEVRRSGTVRAADGPLAGACVTWQGSFRGCVLIRSTVTGPDGRFVLTELPELAAASGAGSLGVATLLIAAPGYEPALVRCPEESWDVTLRPAPRELRPIVVAAESGLPLREATVRAWHWVGPALGPGVRHRVRHPFDWCEVPVGRGPDGEPVVIWPRFSSAEPAFGRLGPRALSAEAPGRAPTFQPEIPAGDAPEIRLEPAWDLAGVVEDAAGRAAAGVSVWLGHRHQERLPWPYRLADDFGTVLTDAQGRYRFRGVPWRPGATSVIRAHLEVGVLEDPPEVTLRLVPDPALAPLRLPPLRSWSLRVTDPEGRPVGGAAVSGAPGGTRRRGFVFARTDAAGSVTVPASAVPGAMSPRLYVSAPGLADATLDPRSLDDLETGRHEVRLSPAHRLAGRLVARSGRRLGRCWILVARSGTDVVPLIAQARQGAAVDSSILALIPAALDGEFEASQLPPPPWTLGVLERRPDLPDAIVRFDGVDDGPPRTWSLGDAESTPGTGQVEVQLENVSGDPQRVGVTFERESCVHAAEGAGSRYLASGLAPGVWIVRVVASERVPVEREIRVEAGAFTACPVSLRSTRSVRGELRVPPGELAGGGVVEAIGQDRREVLRTGCDATGRFTLDGVDPENRYELRVFPARSATVWIPPDSPDLRGAPDSFLTFDLEPAERTAFHWSGEVGGGDISVALHDAEGRRVHAELLNPRGLAILHHPPAARLHLRRGDRELLTESLLTIRRVRTVRLVTSSVEHPLGSSR